MVMSAAYALEKKEKRDLHHHYHHHHHQRQQQEEEEDSKEPLRRRMRRRSGANIAWDTGGRTRSRWRRGESLASRKWTGSRERRMWWRRRRRRRMGEEEEEKEEGEWGEEVEVLAPSSSRSREGRIKQVPTARRKIMNRVMYCRSTAASSPSSSTSFSPSSSSSSFCCPSPSVSTAGILLMAALVFSSHVHTVRAADEYDSLLEISDILPEDAKSYDKMRPPSQGSPTMVYFHVTVMSLDSIDESSMTYAADIFFAQSWKDHRLRFPQNMTGEYRLLPVSWLKDIWRPDAFFKNAKSVIFQTMTIPNHYIWLHLDSTILYMVKLTLLLSCAMNFQSYPHDTQQCAMKIESLSHTTDDLIFVWDPLVPLEVDDRIELPQLDLVSNDTGDCTQVYSTGNFTCLEVVFTFKRRLGYYLFHTYIPTCLIVIMSWISFWIKPEAVPARVTLGVTSLLTLSTQHANSQKSLPPVSYIKAIDMFMSSCTVFVFLSLMEYAMVNVILGDMVDQRPQPENFMQRISRKLTIRRQRSHNDRRRSCNESTIQEAENGGLQEPPPTSSHRQDPHPHHNPFPSRACLPQGPPPPHHHHHPPPVSEAPPVHMMPKLGPAGGAPNMSRTMAAELKEAREKAILVDRFSRIAFPVSFTLLNLLYWAVYFEW